MKPHSLILFVLLSYTTAYTQVFNVEDYKNFLLEHQDMTTEQLLEMHPAGNFLDNISLSYGDALYFDSIAAKYNLTEYEKSLIEKHGFMVSERLKKISFGEAILEIFHSDLPVFVSTDAILHAMHISYDRILQDVEIGLLEPKLIELLNELRNSMPILHNRYSSMPEMITMLRDVDVYLSVPLILMQQTSSPYYSENTATVNYLLNLIEAEDADTTSLFSNNCRFIDWSQFKPRGHYVYDPNIINAHNQEPYFKTMMWFGRTEIYLIKPRSLPTICNPQSFEDIQRQTIDALLIDELFDIASVEPVQQEIDDVIKFFVGESDNVTLQNLDYLTEAVSLDSASQLLDSLKLIEFQDTLMNQSFAYQLILSQILFSDIMNPDSIIPASAFMLFGQRFVMDSYITGSVVFDRILYMGERICRLFPSTLDVLFPLGNSGSAQLLIDELNQYHYSSNLAALRYLIDHYDQTFWQSSFYNYWLNSIRKLNPPEDRNNLPEFMQTAAYWQQKMNTQLSSWTELRHDNLLYAKQSYTGGTICSYPYSYVEPFPSLYSNLMDYCNAASGYFNSLNFPDPYIKSKILSYFNRFYGVSDTLQSICEKELAGIQFTPDEITFLQKMLYATGGSGNSFDGWYPYLFYDDVTSGLEGYEGLMESDHIVADIHTTPTDCGGTMIGAITHVGTGPINIGVVVTENNNNELTAFVGPVMSYFEYTTTNFLRLTDEEWDSEYLQSATRPDWVNIYLADTLGESRGEGRTLITDVSNDYNNGIIPETEILINNYPNPFNPTTIIAFTIPYDLTNSHTTLKIYDIQGNLIRILLKEDLSAGNYLTKWDAKNNAGKQISSGVYIYTITVGHKQKSGKMMFMK